MKCELCGIETDEICVDCYIDTQDKRHICRRPICRDRHEDEYHCNLTARPGLGDIKS